MSAKIGMTSMTHKSNIDAKIIADYFLYKSGQEKKPITNKKLQKLLYYAQGWSLGARGEKLFEDKIEAWVHGPAIRSIYVAYKNFGFDPITRQIVETDIVAIPDHIRRFLDEVWTVYGKFDAEYLEHLSHAEKPWQTARSGLEAHSASENEITPESMQEYFSAKLKEHAGKGR